MVRQDLPRAAALFASAFSIVAIGCIFWVLFFSNAHFFGRELSQEKRHAAIVGPSTPYTTPIKLTLYEGDSNAIATDSADITGNDFWIYYHNDRKSSVEKVWFELKFLSANGTILARETPTAEASLNSAAGFLEAGDRAEAHLRLETVDPRTASVRIETLIQ